MIAMIEIHIINIESMFTDNKTTKSDSSLGNFGFPYNPTTFFKFLYSYS